MWAKIIAGKLWILMGGKMELKKEQSNENLKYDQLSIELQERIYFMLYK